MSSYTDHITWLNTAKAGTYLLGAHMMQVGLWAFINPRSLTGAFGVRYDGLAYSSSGVTTTPADSKSATAVEKGHTNFWPLLFAPREVGFGALVITFAALGEWRAAAVVVGVVGGLLATVDGAVSGLFSKGGWKDAVTSHFVPAGVLLGIAGVLWTKA